MTWKTEARQVERHLRKDDGRRETPEELRKRLIRSGFLAFLRGEYDSDLRPSAWRQGWRRAAKDHPGLAMPPRSTLERKETRP